MKNVFKIISCAFLLIPNISFSQGFQGKAYYQTKTTFEMKLDSTRSSTEDQERFKEMMKKRFEKVFELTFNSSESIYKEEEQLEQPGKGGMRFFGSSGIGKNYKNTKTKTFAEEKDLMGKKFLVKDSLELLDWKFLDESKMIGKYLCLKASAKTKVKPTQFRMRRRGGQNDSNDKHKDSFKEIEIVAWYTPDIPVNNGPGKYWGLPGLILEVNADNTQIVCTKIVLNPKEREIIAEPTKGTVVNEKEFEKIRDKKIKEMREMYGGDRKGNKGGHFRFGG